MVNFGAKPIEQQVKIWKIILQHISATAKLKSAIENISFSDPAPEMIYSTIRYARRLVDTASIYPLEKLEKAASNQVEQLEYDLKREKQLEALGESSAKLTKMIETAKAVNRGMKRKADDDVDADTVRRLRVQAEDLAAACRQLEVKPAEESGL